MRIEPFKLETLASAVQLSKELHEIGTFGRNGPPFDWDHCLGSYMRVVHSPDYYLRFGIDDAGTYVGFVGGHMDTFFFSPKRFAQEDGWYVRPGTIGRTKIAAMLMRGFVTWGLDTMEGLHVIGGDIADIDSLAVDSIYKHLGFHRYGTVYKYARVADV